MSRKDRLLHRLQKQSKQAQSGTVYDTRIITCTCTNGSCPDAAAYAAKHVEPVMAYVCFTCACHILRSVKYICSLPPQRCVYTWHDIFTLTLNRVQ